MSLKKNSIVFALCSSGIFFIFIPKSCLRHYPNNEETIVEIVQSISNDQSDNSAQKNDTFIYDLED